ncbi:unnamed protein product [Urochloa decumbens]|uniref:Homeobox domain-containing protein n=1 Tax=Urochloa decumbens TaxID=240449 RepID=A0ABC8WV18_9POAL
MAHDPSLAYADYFAAATGGVGTLVPEVDAGEDDGQLYAGGVQAHHHGLDMFAAAAHGKGAALGEDFGFGEHRQHQQAPLTSLSLHGPAEAASLALHHHHQLIGGGTGALRQLHQPAAWPQQQQQQQGAWHLRGSRFLRPTQQLLQEFCSLPVETAAASKTPTKPASEDGAGEGSSSSAPASAQIQAMDAAELQRLKAKLYTMLQEVERRYRRYREQMRAVAGSFEAVAGERAAAAYTRLASRTISKHFRSLRDGVAAQMQAVRRALGEKDADGGGGAPGTAGIAIKGETTPRLRVLDQCLRQHRAYQSGVLESQPWRPQRGLPERAVSILRAWLFEHFLHPYPSDVDKHILARQTGLSRSQVSNWFINARVRLWKPMVEEMYAEEMKDPQQEAGAACGNANNNDANNTRGYGASELGHQGRGGMGDDGGERKPTRAQLVHDAGSLASVVSIGSSSRDPQNINFGSMIDGHLGFDAFNDGGGHGFGGGAGGVSLTLGLQQHGDDPHGGVNVAFAAGGGPSAAAHEYLFMAGGGEHHHQQQMAAGGSVHGHLQSQFSAAGMEGDAVSASHYHRGLGAATGFHLLHDLAG